ncbi:Protease 2 [Hordeum vulgare]|nr:Protease 2 [Hordeum vulgare]
MASPKTPKDKIFEKVINLYLAGVLQHPQSIAMREGMLHMRDVEGPKKTGSMEARLKMGKLVSVHYMDKEAFLTNNAIEDEEGIVFYTSPSYDELVAKVEPPLVVIDLNWIVSSPMAERTSMPFVKKMIIIDASNAYRQPRTSKESEVELYAPNACSQPPTSQANEVDVIASEKLIQKDGDGYADDDLDEVEEGFHGIDVGDLDAYILQKGVDHELPFRRVYGSDSDEEDPEEELDKDEFTKEENQIHFELTGLEKITHLFRDLSLAHKVVVDGGMRNTAIEPTPCPDPGEPRMRRRMRMLI